MKLTISHTINLFSTKFISCYAHVNGGGPCVARILILLASNCKDIRIWETIIRSKHSVRREVHLVGNHIVEGSESGPLQRVGRSKMQASVNEGNTTIFGNPQPLPNIVITQIGETKSVDGHQTRNSAKLRFLSPEIWTVVVVNLALSPSTGITEYQANPEVPHVRGSRVHVCRPFSKHIRSPPLFMTFSSAEQPSWLRWSKHLQRFSMPPSGKVLQYLVSNTLPLWC